MLARLCRQWRAVGSDAARHRALAYLRGIPRAPVVHATSPATAASVPAIAPGPCTPHPFALSRPTPPAPSAPRTHSPAAEPATAPRARPASPGHGLVLFGDTAVLYQDRACKSARTRDKSISKPLTRVLRHAAGTPLHAARRRRPAPQEAAHGTVRACHSISGAYLHAVPAKDPSFLRSLRLRGNDESFADVLTTRSSRSVGLFQRVRTPENTFCKSAGGALVERGRIGW